MLTSTSSNGLQLSLFATTNFNKTAKEIKVSKKFYSLNYFLEKVPAGLDPLFWQKAATRANSNGIKDVTFATVRAIYNRYITREEKNFVSHMRFCQQRADNEEYLASMLK